MTGLIVVTRNFEMFLQNLFSYIVRSIQHPPSIALNWLIFASTIRTAVWSWGKMSEYGLRNERTLGRARVVDGDLCFVVVNINAW